MFSIAACGVALLADINWDTFGKNVLSSLVFTAIGLVFFGAAFWIICKMVPFSVRKEIEEDQNTSLAILIGSVIIGIAIIIAAAVHG
jgi:putative membrane protein